MLAARSPIVVVAALATLALLAPVAGAKDVVGGDGPDILIGSAQADTIDAGAGLDLVNALAGDDTVTLGAGTDLAYLGAGDDTVQGAEGADVVYGAGGDDEMSGGPGNDRVLSGPGDDTIDGGAGDDRLVGGPGHDTLDGGDGDDRINALDGQKDVVTCGPGNDVARIDRFDEITDATADDQDGSCESTGRASKRPILLVAGTLAPAFPTLTLLASRLRARGYPVTTLTLARLGTGDMAEAAERIPRAVQRLRARTGAREVDIIGHSQGGLVNRYYVKFLGGAPSVHTYISLGTPQQGAVRRETPTPLGQLVCALAPTVCAEGLAGSPFMENLNAGGDTPPGADFFSIWSSTDGLLNPADSAEFHDGGRNLRVQDYCPESTVTHLGLVFNRAVFELVLSALRGGEIATTC
jgi:triacylglycerol lipase